MIFYYSGCGSSRWVAKRMAASTGERLVFIPDAQREGKMQYTVKRDECLGFVCPVYSWQPPLLVMDFIEHMDIDGTPAYTYLVLTYGDNAGKAQQMFSQGLARQALRLDAAYGVAMPNTYVNMSFMNIDTPEVAHGKMERAVKTVDEIVAHVAARDRLSTVVRGGAAWFKSRVIGSSFNKWLSDKGYRSTDACVGCGRCAEVCPLKNISIEGRRPVWHGHCTQCEACYHYCPQNAVQYGKATDGKGQFCFEEYNL